MEKTSAARFLTMLGLLSLVMVGDVFAMTMVSQLRLEDISWASFVPDLVVGVVTTGGLGVLLFFFARRIETAAEARARKQTLRIEWRATWFWLGQVSALEKEAKPSLESLQDLALGSHLAKLEAGRIYDWNTELGGEELKLLTASADQCRFVENLGRLLEKRIGELVVPGKVHNINEPREVSRAMRSIILHREDEFARGVGRSVAANALSNARQLICDSVIQEYLPRYEIAVPRMYDIVAGWNSVHFEEMINAASRAPHTD